MKKAYYSIHIALLILVSSWPAFGQSSADSNKLAVKLKILAAKDEPKNLYHGPMRILYAKMIVRNKAAHAQEIGMMTCDWNLSWTRDGFYSICGWGCDGNYPIPVTIPAGKALVFYAPLCHEYESEITKPDSVVHFKLGFIAFSIDEFFPSDLSEADRARLKKNRVTYWSNEVTDNVKNTFYRKALNKLRYRHYYVKHRIPKYVK